MKTLMSWAGFLVASAVTLHAQLYDVKVGGDDSTFTGYAVIGASSTDYWNNIGSATASDAAIKTSANATTAVTLTLSGFSGGPLGYGDSDFDPALFKDYDYGDDYNNVATPVASLAFAHLAGDTDYTLELYTSNNADGYYGNRAVAVGTSATSASAIINPVTDDTGFSSQPTLVLNSNPDYNTVTNYNGNYVTVTGTTSFGGDLTFYLSTPNQNTEFDFDALQLTKTSNLVNLQPPTDAPEPGSVMMVLAGMALLSMVAYRRRVSLVS